MVQINDTVTVHLWVFKKAFLSHFTKLIWQIIILIYENIYIIYFIAKVYEKVRKSVETEVANQRPARHSFVGTICLWSRRHLLLSGRGRIFTATDFYCKPCISPQGDFLVIPPIHLLICNTGWLTAVSCRAVLACQKTIYKHFSITWDRELGRNFLNVLHGKRKLFLIW